MPRFVVLNSKFTNKNVSYVKDGGELHQLLQTSGEDAGSPYSKFELESAKSGNGGLVNIRCCYNNKYWALTTNFWVGASADVPNEDVTKRSCTLFEPVYVDDAKTTVRFLHAQNKKFACFWGTGNAYNGCLYAGSESLTNPQNEFEVIDWETLVIFPKHVSFKGDNGNYLRGIGGQGHEYLQYETTDIGSNGVGFEIFPTPNRSVRIKSNFNGKFWRRMELDNPHAITVPNGIYANSTDTSTNNPDTLFLPIKVSDNVVALRNMGNNQFCKRFTVQGLANGLNASGSTISQYERMEVEESVLSRTIYNVVYRLTDSRIYNENTLTMANGFATNSTREPNTITIKLTYTESWSRVWNASLSLSLGIKASIQMGVPMISSKSIEISAEFRGEYAWGETQGTTQELATEYTAIVPPMTRVRVSLLATRGTCDVPFSYSQRDTLTSGKQIIITKDDGVYMGINCFNFRFEATEENIGR